jgi:hypothetical protein
MLPRMLRGRRDPRAAAYSPVHRVGDRAGGGARVPRWRCMGILVRSQRHQDGAERDQRASQTNLPGEPFAEK